jgi:hypothetical protein
MLLKIKQITPYLLLFLTLSINSCKKDSEIEAIEVPTTESPDAFIFYGISTVKYLSIPIADYYWGEASFFVKNSRNSVYVGNVEIGSTYFYPVESLKSIYYKLFKSDINPEQTDPINYPNWGKDTEIRFGSNAEAGFKSGKTNFYLPKPILASSTLNFKVDSGYFLALGGSFELVWNIDSKLDSIDIEIYYSGEYNSTKDTSLSNEDITINKRIPNTGKYLFPPETFSPFKIKSSLNISIRLENRKRIKLNNKVYEINCASTSGLEFKIIEKF